MSIIRCAGGIVFDDAGRLLLIRRGRPPAQGSWSVPGGKCLAGETTQAACVRELAEETGLTVAVQRFAGRVERAAPGGDTFVIDDYVCLPAGGTLHAGDDASEAIWADRATLAALPLVPFLLQTLCEWDLLPA